MKNKMKRNLTFFLLMMTIFSCKNAPDNFEKRVYFDLKVGSSISDAEKFANKFRQENDPHGIFKYPRYKHKLPNNRSYYSTFFYIYSPNDTIVHTVRIYYFIDPKDGDAIIDNAKEETLRMSNDVNYLNVTAKDVLNDVFQEIENKYGRRTECDTSTYSQPYHIISRWKDKDGINISLNYAYWESFGYGKENLYNIKLEFTLTDEMKNKLIKNKSIY